jgi:hypothetical protein
MCWEAYFLYIFDAGSMSACPRWTLHFRQRLDVTVQLLFQLFIFYMLLLFLYYNIFLIREFAILFLMYCHFTSLP